MKLGLVIHKVGSDYQVQVSEDIDSLKGKFINWTGRLGDESSEGILITLDGGDVEAFRKSLPTVKNIDDIADGWLIGKGPINLEQS
jgi:hypothetical protein